MAMENSVETNSWNLLATHSDSGCRAEAHKAAHRVDHLMDHRD